MPKQIQVPAPYLQDCYHPNILCQKNPWKQSANRGDFVTCKGYWCHLKIPNSNFPYSIIHFKIQNKKHYRWETTHKPKSQRESEPRKLKNVNFEKEKATRSPRAQQKHKAKWRNQQQWAPRNPKDFCLRTNERRKNQRKPWKNAKTWSHGPFSQAQGLHCSFKKNTKDKPFLDKTPHSLSATWASSPFL